MVLAAFTTRALPPFGVFYSEDAEETPPWDSGAFATTLGGNGYLLIGNSQVNSTPGRTWPIPSLARFDADGELLYSAYMNNNGTAFDQELIGDRDDTSRFFAGYLGQDQVAHFSIYQGATLTPEYAVSTPIAVDLSMATMTYFPGMMAGLTQNAGTSVRVLVLDSSGAAQIDNVYQSPNLFTTSIPGFGGQTVKLSQVPDESGFFLSIHWFQLDFSNPLNPSNTNRFFLLRLDNSGAIQWSRTFEIASGAAPVQDISAPIADNSYLYRLSNTEISGSTPQTSALLIKVDANGVLGFAKRVEGLRFSSVSPTRSGEDLYLGGSLSDPTNPAAADSVFARLNKNTGEFVDSVVFDQAPLESESVSGVTDQYVYAQILALSEDLEDASGGKITLLRFDRDLSNPQAVEYTRPGFGLLTATGPEDVLFSPYDNATQSIGAIGMDGALSPLDSGCDLFAPTTLNDVSEPLAVSDVDISIQDEAFTVTNGASVLSETSLPVFDLPMLESTCAEILGSGPGGEPSPANLSIRLNEAGSGVIISFASASGVSYDIEFATSVAGPYASVATLAGTGAALEYESLFGGAGGYFRVVSR